jgi:hypothetical protein
MICQGCQANLKSHNLETKQISQYIKHIYLVCEYCERENFFSIVDETPKPNTNIRGNVIGSVFSGNFVGPVNIVNTGNGSISTGNGVSAGAGGIAIGGKNKNNSY